MYRIKIGLSTLLFAFGLAAVSSRSVWADDRSICSKPTYSAQQRRVDACTRLIKGGGLSPAEQAVIYLYRGHARYRGTGWGLKLTDAIADYTESLRLKRSFEGYLGRAQTHGKMMQLRSAIDDYTRAIGLRPKNNTVYHHRAAAYLRTRQHNLAFADYATAIRLRPKDPGPLYVRARAFAKLGSLDRAIADYARIISLKPNGAQAYRNRGLLYLRRAKAGTPNVIDLRKAAADFTQVIRISPNSRSGYSFRSLAHERQFKFDRAIADQEQAVKLGGTFANYSNLGALFRRLGRYDRAIAAYSQGLRKSQAYELYLGRANAYERKGQRQKAIADYRRAAKSSYYREKAIAGLKRLRVAP